MPSERRKYLVQSGTVEAIERHSGALRSTISETDQLKRTLEALKIEAKEDLSEIGSWNAEVDLQLSKADEKVGRLRKWLENRKREDEMTAREDQLKLEMELHETEED